MMKKLHTFHPPHKYHAKLNQRGSLWNNPRSACLYGCRCRRRRRLLMLLKEVVIFFSFYFPNPITLKFKFFSALAASCETKSAGVIVALLFIELCAISQTYFTGYSVLPFGLKTQMPFEPLRTGTPFLSIYFIAVTTELYVMFSCIRRTSIPVIFLSRYILFLFELFVHFQRTKFKLRQPFLFHNGYKDIVFEIL